MPNMDSSAEFRNLRTVRIVYKKEYITEKELIKEFLRLIGCFVCPFIIKSEGDIEALQQVDAHYDVEIFLNCDSEELRESEAVRNMSGRKIAIYYNIEKNYFKRAGILEKEEWEEVDVDSWLEIKKPKCEAARMVIEFLIHAIWRTDGWSGEKQKEEIENIRSSVSRINQLFCDYKLFIYLQSKRALLLMGICSLEKLRRSRNPFVLFRNRQIKVYDSEMVYLNEERPTTYLRQMIRAFLNLYQELQYSTEEESVYTVYTRVNAARKVRELVNALEDNVWNRIQEVERFLEHITADDLLSQLGKIIEKDREFIGVYPLATFVCKAYGERAMKSGYYFDEFRKILQEDKMVSTGFLWYQLSVHYEKTWGNWENAYSYYKKAVEVNPRCYQAWFKVGVYYLERNGYSHAKEAFDKVINILRVEDIAEGRCSLKEIQYCYKAYFQLAELFLALDYHNMARDHLSKAIEVVKKYCDNDCVLRACDDSEEVNGIELEGSVRYVQKYHCNSFPIKVLIWNVKDMCDVAGYRDIYYEIERVEDNIYLEVTRK